MKEDDFSELWGDEDDMEDDLDLLDEQEEQWMSGLYTDIDYSLLETSILPPSTPGPIKDYKEDDMEPRMVPDTGVSFTNSSKELVVTNHDGWATETASGLPRLISITPDTGLATNSPPACYDGTPLTPRVLVEWEDVQEVSLGTEDDPWRPLLDDKKKEGGGSVAPTLAPSCSNQLNQLTGKLAPIKVNKELVTQGSIPVPPATPWTSNDDFLATSKEAETWKRPDVLVEKQEDDSRTTPTQELMSTTTSSNSELSHSQGTFSNRGVKVKGVLLTGQGGGVRGVKGQCQHARGGYCSLHGWGAVKKFEPVVKFTTGPGGKQIKKYSRKTYYECEEGATGIQTQLSFRIEGEADIPELTVNKTGGGDRDICSDFSSTTVGQDVGFAHTDRGKM